MLLVIFLSHLLLTPKSHAPVEVHLSTRDVCVLIIPVNVTYGTPETILIGLHRAIVLLLLSDLDLQFCNKTLALVLTAMEKCKLSQRMHTMSNKRF